MVVVCALVVLAWLGSDAWGAAEGYSQWPHVPEQRVQKRDRAIALLLDYPLTWPATVSLRHYQFPDLENFLAQHPPKKVWIADSGGQSAGTASVLNWGPRKVHLQIQAQQGAIPHINHFYYPDWRADIEGGGQPLAVQHDANGLLQIPVPAGTYNIRLRMERAVPENFGIAISLCFCSCCSHLHCAARPEGLRS
jgi:hypothetical protein